MHPPAGLVARLQFQQPACLHLEEGDGEAVLREDFALRRPEPSRQSSDLALGVLVRTCAAVLGGGWAPSAVCFSHEAPPPADLAVFTRLFRCPLQFNSEFNALILPAADLDRPNVLAISSMGSLPTLSQ